jgi:hypothetical protein
MTRSERRMPSPRRAVASPTVASSRLPTQFIESGGFSHSWAQSAAPFHSRGTIRARSWVGLELSMRLLLTRRVLHRYPRSLRVALGSAEVPVVDGSGSAASFQRATRGPVGRSASRCALASVGGYSQVRANSAASDSWGLCAGGGTSNSAQSSNINDLPCNVGVVPLVPVSWNIEILL